MKRPTRSNRQRDDHSGQPSNAFLHLYGTWRNGSQGDAYRAIRRGCPQLKNSPVKEVYIDNQTDYLLNCLGSGAVPHIAFSIPTIAGDQPGASFHGRIEIISPIFPPGGNRRQNSFSRQPFYRNETHSYPRFIWTTFCIHLQRRNSNSR